MLCSLATHSGPSAPALNTNQLYVTKDRNTSDLVRVKIVNSAEDPLGIYLRAIDFGNCWKWDGISKLVSLNSDIPPMAKPFYLCGVPENSANLYQRFSEFRSSSIFLKAMIVGSHANISDYLIDAPGQVDQHPLSVFLFDPRINRNHYQALLFDFLPNIRSTTNYVENDASDVPSHPLSTELIEQIQMATPKSVGGKFFESEGIPVLSNYNDLVGDLPPLNTWSIAQIVHIVDNTNIVYVAFPFGFQSESSINDASSAMLIRHIKHGYTLKRLSAYMDSCYKPNSLTPVDVAYNVGEAVLVYLSGNKRDWWVRGKVVDYSHDVEWCKVFLLDYGLEKMVYIDNMFRMPDNLLGILPAQAVRVVLNRKTPLPHLTTSQRNLLLSQFVFLRRVKAAEIVEIAIELQDTHTREMIRFFTGIQPTGALHLGHYFGVISQILQMQKKNLKPIVMIADLHALTSDCTITPDFSISRQSRLLASLMMSCGIDTCKTTIYKQSDICEHAELFWILSNFVNLSTVMSVPTFNDLRNKPGITLGRLAYPVLQSADILLVRATHVPVGKDQVAHVELSRNIATRINKQLKINKFPLPKPILDEDASCVMSLRDPTKKMSKSDTNRKGSIFLTDSDEDIAMKVRLALTDSLPGVTSDPNNRHALYNLQLIAKLLGTHNCTTTNSDMKFLSVRELKDFLTTGLVDLISSIRQKTEALTDAEVDDALQRGKVEIKKIADMSMRSIRNALSICLD